MRGLFAESKRTGSGFKGVLFDGVCIIIDVY